MTEPTDAEIFVVAREAGLLPDNSHPAPETRAARKHSNAVQAFARAVLTKWGTPPAVAGEPAFDVRVGALPTMTQDEYPGLGDWWVQLRLGPDFDQVLARVYGASPDEARWRAFTIAARLGAATQAQAGAVPLTDEQLAEIMRETWGCASIAPRHAIGFARAIERAHGIGIKGGQHGADTRSN